MAGILRETTTGQEWRLDEGDQWVIGRSREADITVPGDDQVARRHARISWRNGQWLLEDLASTNGVALNGALLRQEEIRVGDVIRIGRQAWIFRDDGIPPRLPATAQDSGARLPQSFTALLTLFNAPLDTIDSALIAAKAGTALLRHCGNEEHGDDLKAAWTKGLASPWPVIRAVSAHGLAGLSASGGVNQQAAALAVGALLEDPADYVQRSAARALAQIDPVGAAPRVHALAMAALDEGEPGDARESAAELADLGNSALLDSLRRKAEAMLFDDRAGPGRIRAAAALEQLAAAGDAAAIRPLRTLLSNASEEIRLTAVRALSRSALGLEEARDALRSAVADPSPIVFRAVYGALANSRDPLLAERLIAILRTIPRADLERRAQYRRALEDVTGERRGPDPDSWL